LGDSQYHTLMLSFMKYLHWFRKVIGIIHNCSVRLLCILRAMSKNDVPLPVVVYNWFIVSVLFLQVLTCLSGQHLTS